MATIIEFYGLPGSGKTSVSLSLKKILMKNKNDVESFEDIFQKYRKKKLFAKLFFFLKLLIVRFKFVINIIVYSFYYGISLDIAKRVKIALLHEYLIYLYCRKNQNAIIILEEGFIQNILSFAYSNSLIVNKRLYRLIEIIKKNYKNLYFIYCEIDTFSAIERISKRNNNNKRFNPNNKPNLKLRLDIRKTSEKEINKIIDKQILCSLNMNETIEQNANKTFNEVVKLLI
jgi:thymidylate kinase